jgi:MOSC domain-containing protein YiiM
MSSVLSVNVGLPRPVGPGGRPSAIDKRPVPGAVEVVAPGPRGPGGSGLVGDDVCDRVHHGGDDQAVYAYAREDLDAWEVDLGRPLASGSFGENLTTPGVDVSGTLVGERWRVGDELLLEVSDPRIPCRTFATWLDERGWVRRFTQRAAPGTYLRVLRAGAVRPGDPVTVVHRPDHDVTVALAFRAMTAEPELLGRLVDLPALSAATRAMATRRTRAGSSGPAGA